MESQEEVKEEEDALPQRPPQPLPPQPQDVLPQGIIKCDVSCQFDSDDSYF